MVDIINQYAPHYEECILLTGLLNPRNNQLQEKVKIEPIITYNRQSTARRLFTWTCGTIQVLLKLWFRHRKAELFIVSNPPFSTLIPLVSSHSFSLLIYDIYPDALVEYRILKENSPLVKMWKWANRKVFAKAKKIFTITESMQLCLERYISEPNRIKVVPVWTDNRFFSPIAKKENPFIRDMGLEDKFVVLYSGNLGYTHDVEILVELAAQATRPELYFLIIGEGDKQKLVQDKIALYNLQNCRWLPWQPTEMLPYSLSAADLAVVTLGREASKLSIPSKTFNFMSVGVPILTIADPFSELSQLVKRHEMGANYRPDAVAAMLQFIEQLLDNPDYHDQLKVNARKASQSYGPDNARLFWDNSFTSQCHDL